MSDGQTELARATYDKVAGTYDDLWSRYVAEPNARLTGDLKLKKGERSADLACGTGVQTLEMARLTAPGEIVAVDLSQAMLDATRTRLTEAGFAVTGQCATAQDFIANAAEASYDAVSMRFALAYLDWREVLPQMGRLVRKGGRIGVITNLTASAPQALKIYHDMMTEMGQEPVSLPVPETGAVVAELLERGGLQTQSNWHHHFRLWFNTGRQACTWMRQTGFVTHPALEAFDPEILEELVGVFGDTLEAQFREASGVPLDFTVAGVTAVRL